MRRLRLTTRFFLGVLTLAASLSFNASGLFASIEETADKSNTQTKEYSHGLPNPSSRPLAKSRSYGFFADLLVWCAKESGTENWAEVINTKGSAITCDIRDVHFGWDAGFRVGVGYGMRHDRWDTQFYYTRFHTRGNDHVSSAPGSVFSSYIGNFYVDNPSGKGISGVAYQTASVHWTIHFNIFDWELGRAFWVSKALSIRPYVGVKGGWIDQAIHTKWQNPNLSKIPGAELFNTARENLKNNFWGLGPSGGLNTTWNLLTRQNHSLSLFGDLSGAIMYGHWRFGDVYKNDIQQEVSIKLSHINGGATMVRTIMGFGWDANCCQDRCHFSARLGYEMQFWLDQLQFYSFDTGRLSNELTLQGGTLDFRFDF
jgi:hypothetical protein